MRRREFITLLGGAAAAWPIAARAQQAAKVARIGLVGLTAADSLPQHTEAFRAGLRDLGYQEGRDIVIEFRWAEGRYEPAEARSACSLAFSSVMRHLSASPSIGSLSSWSLRDTILQLNDDGLDPQCIVEALIVQAVGLAFAEYGRAEGQYLVEGTVNVCFREAARLAPRAEPTH